MPTLTLKVAPSTHEGRTTYRVYARNLNNRWERVDRTSHKTEAEARSLYAMAVERGDATFIN